MYESFFKDSESSKITHWDILYLKGAHADCVIEMSALFTLRRSNSWFLKIFYDIFIS
jgi:hypothetical protein